jgi:predicted secreted hydrolase
VVKEWRVKDRERHEQLGTRRRFLATLPALAFSGGAWPSRLEVRQAHELIFPRDHGAHAQYRTEWWYITGWVSGEGGSELGVQVTFFRSRPGVQEDNPSAFAPKELVFAHCAVADPRLGRLRHDQRAARAGLGLADAEAGNTRVWVEDWSLQLTPQGYIARVPARDFDMALTFKPTQAILLEGDRGFSRKGPKPAQASYYYSWPHLGVDGTIAVQGTVRRVSGQAWLDHEWSNEYLASEAAGWDWIGINLSDGGALMAFRIRTRDGRDLWAGGTLRDASGRTRVFGPNEIRFQPLRNWRSPRTNAEYPVAMEVTAGPIKLRLDPLMPDQELDSLASTGTIYWEGAVRAIREGVEVGRGYLELTGYASGLRL